MTSASSPPNSTAGYATGTADGELTMISSDRVLGFALTSLVIIVVPGPGVLFVVGVPSRMAAGWRLPRSAVTRPAITWSRRA